MVRRAVTIRTLACAALLAGIAFCAGCASVPENGVTEVTKPSNHRNWEPYLSKLATAEVEGDDITVHNVRNCIYITDEDYIVNHFDKQFQVSDIQSVDFIVVPFKAVPTLAHTMLSFGLQDGQHLGVSVETRLEEGEKYTPLAGIMRQFELMYVVADERDLVRLRTRHRKAEVYVYPTRATPEQAQSLFLDMMARANKLAREPEFYDTLTNNCTTNIFEHVNRLHPGRVPYNYAILFPGLADRYVYDLGLIDTQLSFEETKRLAKVNDLAERYYDSPAFSRQIRLR